MPPPVQPPATDWILVWTLIVTAIGVVLTIVVASRDVIRHSRKNHTENQNRHVIHETNYKLLDQKYDSLADKIDDRLGMTNGLLTQLISAVTGKPPAHDGESGHPPTATIQRFGSPGSQGHRASHSQE